MKPPRFRYLRAESVDGALQALADNEDARILAGGQSLIPLMNLRMVKPACRTRLKWPRKIGQIVTVCAT
jgi:CO/xanthine dehydrogenase FAD-binding subunit